MAGSVVLDREKVSTLQWAHNEEFISAEVIKEAL